MFSAVILLCGIATVVVTIAGLRWHPILALIAAAALIAAITPRSVLEQYELHAVARQDPAARKGLDHLAGSTREQIEANLQKRPLTRVIEGFLNTCKSIGWVIAMAAIIGKCLLQSGAAERIIRAALRLVGERRAPWAFVASGFVLGVPVFFDTIFFLMIPLAKSLYLKTRKSYLLYVMSIVVGATMAHSLVPPTPGPLLVAKEVGIDFWAAVLGGSIVGVISVAAGYAYCVWANRRWTIVPDTVESPSIFGPAALGSSVITSSADTTPEPAPPLWFALLPIVIPLALILVGPQLNHWQSYHVLSTAVGGDKNVALTVAAIAAMWMQAVYRGERSASATSSIWQATTSAMRDGALTIMITASGGALGTVIRQTDIADVIASSMPQESSGVLLLVVAFVVTALVRCAQGSATVSMITAVGIIAPVATHLSLPYHSVYLYLAIGCGSKPLPWMNDSGFWIVSRMSGMTTVETFKTFTVALTVMGCVGFVATLLGACFLPLR
ncbi:MAG: GntP family permease [Pirellulaceae bacterium]|nr:GntP family permease [Planctomycetales bacterium]